jgi:hypothetical protein
MNAPSIRPRRANHRHGSAEGKATFCSFHAGFAFSGISMVLVAAASYPALFPKIMVRINVEQSSSKRDAPTHAQPQRASCLSTSGSMQAIAFHPNRWGESPSTAAGGANGVLARIAMTHTTALSLIGNRLKVRY